MQILLSIIFTLFLTSCKPVSNIENIENDKGVSSETFDTRPTIVFDVIRIRSSPRIETFWAGDMPEFIFCKSSGISRTRASQGISYWRRLGYPIENVRYNVEGPECRGDTPEGKVVIRLIDNTIPIHQNLAVTKVYYETHSKMIRRSSIYLISVYSNRPRLIEHEIGHALGWKHHNRNLHIMNSEYDDTGHDSAGLRYSNYLDQVFNFF
tara:strand:+ start:1395 stop:2021 length:627 start_codon:yes stop_codon:yes gene_type:complete